tara:strand:+ start:1411 stop:3027 length:1617 start_codon:yes stop_codon:yes gene_type:complete
MARLEANLTVKAGNGADYLCEMTEQYSDILTAQQIIDNADEYTQIATLGPAASIGGNAGLRMAGAKLVIVKNNSDIPIELQFLTTEWKDNSNVDELNSVDLGPDSATSVRQFSYILSANEYMVLPSTWMVSYAEAHSAGNAVTIDNKGGYDVNSGKLYSTAIVDIATALENDTTTFVVDDTDYFSVGDLIQLGSTTGTTATNIEIARVASITNSTTMILERGLYGSITADKDAQTDSTNGAVVNAKVYLPWFNTQEDYDKYHDDANALGIAQTNKTGRYTAQNLFGYGRTADAVADGIVKGSLAFKFYNAGFQEFGMSGVTPSTHSGLAASTAYQFNITVDGGSTFVDLAFTTDASNLNFGGNNGIISKIQAALDAQYYTAGNLFEKTVSVGIVGGDIRFTSGTRTRNSAILLAAPGSGTTPFGVGRLPAIASVEKAVASKLPDDTIEDKTYNISKSNKNIFAYDDGKGNILGAATGTINYETGAIDIQGPANAEIVASFNYDSAHSGGLNNNNTIRKISARSLNSKINAKVEILGFV